MVDYTYDVMEIAKVATKILLSLSKVPYSRKV